MALATEAHAVSDGDGFCAEGRGAEHGDGFLSRLEVVIRDAVHVHVGVGLGLAQLRRQVGLLVARRRIRGLPRGGDIYGRTRHGVVGHADVRLCRVRDEGEARAVVIVWEK